MSGVKTLAAPCFKKQSWTKKFSICVLYTLPAFLNKEEHNVWGQSSFLTCHVVSHQRWPFFKWRGEGRLLLCVKNTHTSIEHLNIHYYMSHIKGEKKEYRIIYFLFHWILCKEVAAAGAVLRADHSGYMWGSMSIHHSEIRLVAKISLLEVLLKKVHSASFNFILINNS